MLAFTFPGQGSQQPGMGAPWVDHPSWALVDQASAASGRDVAGLLLHADADELRRTENAQLSTYVLSLVVHDAVEALGVRCHRAAGHSLGEYSALTATGALALEDGVRLVTERGAAMQAAADARPGTMAAVLGADDEVVAEACAKVAGDVWVANTNGAGQVVIAGDPVAIEEAAAIAKDLGARRVMPLPVGGAFHTPFMAPAAERLRTAIARTAFRDASVPIVANVDALPHQHADQWADLLAAQLTAPVRWRQTIDRMVADGVTTFVELGPGSVLTGVAKRQAPGGTAKAAATPEALEAVVEAARSVGAVFATAAASTHPPLTPAHHQTTEPAPMPVTIDHEGEHLFAAERLVVSPAAGVFTPVEGIAEGHEIDQGHVLGHVAGHEVRSAFRGTIKGVLAVAGERLTHRQPVAWLRTA
ncbi:MAG: ACP S-malonyltransferase [Acidimicrobiia bacterium]